MQIIRIEKLFANNREQMDFYNKFWRNMSWIERRYKTR